MSDMEAIDKKINEVANDHLDGLEDSLKHMDLDSIRLEINKMLDDCDINELQKVAKILINLSRKSYIDEQLNNLYLPQVKVSPVCVLDIHGVFLYTDFMTKHKNLNLKSYFICDNKNLSVTYIKRCEKFLRQLNYILKNDNTSKTNTIKSKKV